MASSALDAPRLGLARQVFVAVRVVAKQMPTSGTSPGVNSADGQPSPDCARRSSKAMGPTTDSEQHQLRAFGSVKATIAIIPGRERDDESLCATTEHPDPPEPDRPHHQEHPVQERSSTHVTKGPEQAVVTGTAGFIGSHLARALLQDGTTVIGVDRRDPATDHAAAENLAVLRGQPGYTHITADLATCEIDPLLIDTGVIFHMAGLPGVQPSWGPQFSEYLACNILATQRLMESAIRMNVPRLVVASSSSVYGSTSGIPSAESDTPRPSSPYAITKLAEEQLCLAHAARDDCPTSVAALRYFSVYGPRQRADMFTHRALKAALTSTPLRVYGDGHQRRDFTFIDDAVAATIAAATTPEAQGIFNVGNGSAASLLEVIDIAEALVDREIQILTKSMRNGDVPVTQADSRRAREVLGWQPAVGLRAGMHTQLTAMSNPAYGTEPLQV